MSQSGNNIDFNCSFCAGENEENSVYCIHCGNSLAGDDGGAGDDSRLPPGSQVREFKIVRLVGEGGMGQVYEAVHAMTGARVAVKRMSPTLSADEGVRRRFIEEARVMTLLDHPGIVGINQFFVENGRFFLVMKFIDGKGADDLVDDFRAKGQFMPVPEAVGIAAQTASALNYMHSVETEQEVADENGQIARRKIRGVIHRDIKPANIMVDKQGGAFLTDFGIAKAVGREKMTKVGGVVGTFEYMSPEQVQGEEGVGPASDQYSLAVALFQLLTGTVPFEQKTDGGFDAMEGHVHKTPPAPSSFRPEVTSALDAIVMQALAKNPADRFPDCAAFGQALKGALEGKAPVQRAVPSPTPVPGLTTVPGPTGKPVGLYIGIGIGIVALVTLVLVLAIGSGGKKGDDVGKGSGSGRTAWQSTSKKEESPTRWEKKGEEKKAEAPKEIRTPSPSEGPAAEKKAEPMQPPATTPARDPLPVKPEEKKAVCIPNCAGDCGPDGCGGNCGKCYAGRICQDDFCVCKWDECKRECCAEGEMCSDEGCCKPNCKNKRCGDNGCGWPCGTCPSDKNCVGGQCVSQRIEQLYVTADASVWNYMNTKKRDRYAPGKLLDGSVSTAWCKDDGVGSWVKLSTSGSKTLSKLRVRNGYQKYKNDKYGDRFYLNSRVANATIRFSDGSDRNVRLDDSKDWQEIDLAGVRSSSVKLTVGSAYWGNDRSVCISEMELYGTD